MPISRRRGTSSSRAGIRKRRRTRYPQRWRKSSSGGTQWNPRPYARGTPISNLIKSKQRGLQRIRKRLAQRGDVSFEQDLDPGEVLACMADRFTPQEIAELLGKTEAAGRQNLRAARRKLASCLAETGSTGGAATTTGRRPDELQWPCT